MNRFASKSFGDYRKSKKIFRLLPLVLGILVIMLFLSGVNYISDSSADKQFESLSNAITRDIAQCYAVEGAYPPSLDYIVEHYGLTYDSNMFFVDYQAIGSNIYPDVTIIKLKAKDK